MHVARPIRVLHICTIRLTARAFIAPVAQYLRVRGYEIGIACSANDAADGPGLSVEYEIAGCPLYSVAIARTIRPLQDLYSTWKLYRLIRRLQPAIVHTQTSKAGVVGRIAARLAGVPVVIHTAHAFPFHPYLPTLVRWAYMMIERMAARWVDLIMVDTESVRTEGLRYRIVRNPAKLVTVPMGISLKKFSPSLQGPDNLRTHFGFGSCDLVVGTVARLVPDKGLECFLRMAALILAKRSDTRFLIVGEGPLRHKLEGLADSLSIRKAVVFAGHQTDVPPLLEVMDIFVLPTLREGFGVVFAEAMAMGKATVGSRIGPVAEVIEDGITGYLAPPEDPEEFAKRTLELLADQDKRRAFGEAGRRRVETMFSEERMCETIESHYRRLLTDKGIFE